MALKLQGTNSAAAPGLTNDGNDGIAVGTDSIDLSIAGASKFKVGSAGQLGIGGANYGTSGQVLKSGGASAAPTWGTDTGGKILGMNSVTYDNTQRTVDSTTWFDSGMEITYTPTASNSTALISLFGSCRGNTSQFLYFQLRQADAILGGGDQGYVPQVIGASAEWTVCAATWHVSPTWTADTQTSFQIYVKKHTSSQGATYLGWGTPSGTNQGTYKDGLIIQEVAA